MDASKPETGADLGNRLDRLVGVLVPRWLAAEIVRSMQDATADRYASATASGREMQRDPHPHRDGTSTIRQGPQAFPHAGAKGTCSTAT